MKESSLLDRALAGMMIAGLTTVLWMDRGLRGLVILLAVMMGVFCVVGFWRDKHRTKLRGMEELRSMHDNQRREIAAMRKRVDELEAEAALHRDRHRGSVYRRSGHVEEQTEHERFVETRESLRTAVKGLTEIREHQAAHSSQVELLRAGQPRTRDEAERVRRIRDARGYVSVAIPLTVVTMRHFK